MHFHAHMDDEVYLMAIMNIFQTAHVAKRQNYVKYFVSFDATIRNFIHGE